MGAGVGGPVRWLKIGQGKEDGANGGGGGRGWGGGVFVHVQ